MRLTLGKIRTIVFVSRNCHLFAVERQLTANQLVVLRRAQNYLVAKRVTPRTLAMFSDFTEAADGSQDGTRLSTSKDMERIWEEKSRLRSEMKRRLATIQIEEKERQSEIVRNKLFNHDVYKKSQKISVFLSMDDEIRTLDILKQMFTDKKTVFIPRYSGKLGRMDMVLLASWEDYENLPVTKWKIKQPPTDDDRPDALQTGGLDLVIMPGLAFTDKGHRLGRGKGYYDSFLTRSAAVLTEKPYTIAVAFKQQIIPNIPLTDTDVILDEVLYEDS